MGEKLKPFNNQPTVQEKDSQRLDENSFFSNSQTPEGLSIYNNEQLREYISSTNNIDDILYTSKFISDKDIFLEILEQEEREDVKELMWFLCDVFSNLPSISEVNSMDLGKEGFFIAYINDYNKQVDFSWKKKETDGHLFNSIIKRGNRETSHYPDELRSAGKIATYLDEGGVPNVEFSGDASKGDFKYAPGYVENFKEEIEEYFKSKYLCEEVKVHS